MKAGLNLYSLRKFIKTEEELLSTANRLKDMGYDYLQFSGVQVNAEWAEILARVCEQTQMPVCLTHNPLD